jgi:NAD(P)-dependent dehydrogenase (short-subunit alcohol dehydrogenase family)
VKKEGSNRQSSAILGLATQHPTRYTISSTMASPSSLFSVAGKNVLVTGGSRGIGLMIAKGFVNAGANVLLTSRSEQACQEAASEISCNYVVSNVGNRAGCEQLAQDAAQFFDNRLDVLVNNAGTSWGEPLERKSGKANWGFDKVLDLVRERIVVSRWIQTDALADVSIIQCLLTN